MGSFASCVLLLLLWTTPLYTAGSSTTADTAVVQAIERAVQDRVGREVSVRVSDVSGVRLAADASVLIATPDGSGRIGAPVRFVLADGRPGRSRARVGEATATVRISAPAVRARRAIARGAHLDAEDVASVDSDLSGRPFRPLLSIDSALGARAIRDIAADAILTETDLMIEPIVKAGDLIRARVRVGDVELASDVVAAENGQKNEIIRVVNPESRHTFRARVVSSGEVEVVNVR